MALFGKSSEPKLSKVEIKARKEEEKLQKFLERYHLETLNEFDYQIVKKIAADLAGNTLMKTGMALSLAKAEDQLTVTYLSALVEQNWIIINQLGRIHDFLMDTSEE